jgi:predicted GNAT superfamily acetyltransferase
MSEDGIVIRKCSNLDEMAACVALQKEIWNFTDADVVPLRMFVVAGNIGGQVIAAIDEGEIVGFALSVPGARGGHPYLHSQMLGVRATHRNAGLGRRIKLFQREDALDRGFELIEWTFDPLEIKNAYLNIERLGAVARRYTVNQYGLTSSALQGGLPSDRLVAEWWLKSKRVENMLQSVAKPAFETVKAISVPGQIYAWRETPATRDRARELQEANRRHFLEAFSAGLTVLGYERDQQGTGRFLLGRWEENWLYAS